MNKHIQFLKDIWESHPASDIGHWVPRCMVYREWYDPKGDSTERLYKRLDRAYAKYRSLIEFAEERLEDEHYDWRA